jgi:formylglycine-generating enzyme required for sulfatase activity
MTARRSALLFLSIFIIVFTPCGFSSDSNYYNELFSFSQWWQQPVNETNFPLNRAEDTIIDEKDLLLLLAQEPFEPAEIAIPLPGLAQEVQPLLLVKVPAGHFIMGANDPGWSNYNEHPPHRVDVKHSFYMGKFEITQAQWLAVMGNWPGRKPQTGTGDDYPAYNISWEDCQSFIAELNKLGYGTFRLPTEAEWEHASRAGSSTRWCYGNDDSLLNDYAWAGGGNRSRPVGGKLPNAWNLHDMHGNVYEWCEDDWHDRFSLPGRPDDGSAWIDNPRGSHRSARGGSWATHIAYSRSSSRDGLQHEHRSEMIGFRVVMSANYIELTSPNEKWLGYRSLGCSISGIQDINSDGMGDIIVGARGELHDPNPVSIGRVYAISGADGALIHTLTSPDNRMDANFGYSVSDIPDVNGDGRPDMLVGSVMENPYETPGNPGRVYIFSGGNGALLSTIAPPPNANLRFGYSVSGIEDIDGDGRGDVIVGSPFDYYNNDEHIGTGAVYVFSGATGTLLHTLTSPQPKAGDHFGNSVADVADVDGDGLQDVAIGSMYSDHRMFVADCGGAFIFSGSTGVLLREIIPPKGQLNGRFGYSVASLFDVNEDGYGDVIVGAPDETTTGDMDNTGRAYIYSGADGMLLHELVPPEGNINTDFGFSVSGVQDINGDGRDDVIIGDNLGWEGRTNAIHSSSGRAYVFSGYDGKFIRKLRSPNEQSNGQFAYAVSCVPDADGDGSDDIAVGALRESRTDPLGLAGSAYIFYSGKSTSGIPPLPTTTPTATPTMTATSTSTPTSTPTPLPDPGFHKLALTIPGLPEDARPLEVIKLPAGSFTMGSDEVGISYNNEKPSHQVDIGHDFYIGRYEITQAQWLVVMGEWPGESPHDSVGVGYDYPAYNLSWNDCQAFIARLNTWGKGFFRLPTEAEWEYACRAGSTTKWFSGDEENMLDSYAWYLGNNTPLGSKPVGSKLPNAWHLYDMTGNVFEWCEDDWHINYSPADRPDDGSSWVGDPRASHRVIRGGGWNVNADYSRSAARNGSDLNSRDGSIGFRIVWRPMYIELASPNNEDGGIFGRSVSGVPDLDGDGRGDVIVGAYGEDPGINPTNAGRAYIYSGAGGVLLHTLVSPNEQEYGNFGNYVSGINDIDGDGCGDVIVGAYNEKPDTPRYETGLVYLFSGGDGTLLHTLISPNAEEDGRFGGSVSRVPDVDGDGRDDVIVGAWMESPGNSPIRAGRAYVFSGSSGMLLHTLVSTHEMTNGEFGLSVSGISDINGDGRGDVIVGTEEEAAYIFSGSDGTLLHWLESPVGTSDFGSNVCGIEDVDGDGRGDVIISTSNSAYVYSGSSGKQLHLLVSPNPASNGRFGFSASSLGDMDGDGRDDFIIGAYREGLWGRTSRAGRAYIYSGSRGALLWTLISPNEERSGYFGHSVSGVSDMDGDGRSDILIGAYREAPGSNMNDAGRAYIFPSSEHIPTQPPTLEGLESRGYNDLKK